LVGKNISSVPVVMDNRIKIQIFQSFDNQHAKIYFNVINMKKYTLSQTLLKLNKMFLRMKTVAENIARTK